MQMQVDSPLPKISLCNAPDDLAHAAQLNVLELVLNMKNLSGRGMSD